jgi:hypothetical protein
MRGESLSARPIPRTAEPSDPTTTVVVGSNVIEQKIYNMCYETIWGVGSLLIVVLEPVMQVGCGVGYHWWHGHDILHPPNTPYQSDVADEEWAFLAPYFTFMREEGPRRSACARATSANHV